MSAALQFPPGSRVRVSPKGWAGVMPVVKIFLPNGQLAAIGYFNNKANQVFAWTYDQTGLPGSKDIPAEALAQFMGWAKKPTPQPSTSPISIAHLKALACALLERRITDAALQAEACLTMAHACSDEQNPGYNHGLDVKMRAEARQASRRAFAAAAELEAIKAFQP